MKNFNIVILPKFGDSFTACEGYQAIDAARAASAFLEDLNSGDHVYAYPHDAECHCDDYRDCEKCGAVILKK